MGAILTSSEMRSMNAAALRRAANSILARPRINTAERVQELRGEVKAFEKKYKMKTSRMLEAVCSGAIVEKGEIEDWVVKYNLLKVHEQA